MKTHATTSIRHSGTSATTRRTTSTFAAALIATVATLSVSGCSALFVNGPPKHARPGEKIDCTTRYDGPVIDGLFAGLEAARTIYAATQSDSAYQGQTLSKPADIFLGAALTGVFAVSMGVGASKVSDCREATGDGMRQLPAEVRLRQPTSWAAAQVVAIPSEDADDDAEAARYREEAKAAADARAAGEAARKSLQAARAITPGKSGK